MTITKDGSGSQRSKTAWSAITCPCPRVGIFVSAINNKTPIHGGINAQDVYSFLALSLALHTVAHDVKKVMQPITLSRGGNTIVRKTSR